MLISIASDHAGYEQKQQLIEFLREEGYELIDQGPHNEDRVDYPVYAYAVAQDVSCGRADRGVLVCGTGIGMALAADKVDHCRAANIITPEFASLCREHNDANIITLSGRFVDLETNKEILRRFLTTKFAGGRHASRVAQIMQIEER